MKTARDWKRQSFIPRIAPFAMTAVAGAVLLTGPTAHAGDVSFKDAFLAAEQQDVIAITVPDTDVLVFDGGVHFTQGRRLTIMARKVRLGGETRIGFYPPDSRPPIKSGTASTGLDGAAGANGNCGRSGCAGGAGQPGAAGAAGDPGAAASTMVLDIQGIEGDGRLILTSAGQAGGEGQKAGKGGTGGRGGDGAKRSCGGALGLDTRAGPGDGGTGGTGGPGGKGGTGGPGGAGGAIMLSANLAEALEPGRIVVDLEAARGGPGGAPGDKGNPGAGGSGGGGNSCGGGGSTGSSGADGSEGTPGDVGPFGSAGSLRYWIGNELGIAVPAPAGEATPAETAPATQQVRQSLRFEAPSFSRDCPRQAAMVLPVAVPEGQAVTQLEAVKVVNLQGAMGFAQAPVLQPVAGQPQQLEVRAVFQRVIVPRPEVRIEGFLPKIWVHESCPPLVVELEVTFLATPIATPLGAKLTEP